MTTLRRPKRPDGIGDIAGLFAIFLFMAGVGAAFAQPWLSQPGVAGPALDRYAPAIDADARLTSVYDKDGALLGWNSQNVALLPGLRGIAYDLRPAIGQAVLAQYGPGDTADAGRSLDWLRNIQLIEARDRFIDLNGNITTTLAAYVRESRGLFLIGLHNAANNADLIFDPPLLVYPSDLQASSAWRSEGAFAGATGYRSESRVVAAGPRKTDAGEFDDCLQIESTLRLLSSPPIETRSVDWVCAGAGVIETEMFDTAGALIRRHSSNASPARFPPTPLLANAAQQATAPDLWQLSVFAKANLTGAEIESTIPPVWLPVDPPIVLAAAYRGDLLAFSAVTETGHLVWRFHTGGSIFSPPAFDPARGRIYFGSTDKRLYALDARGLFLWSFASGDNIATRPAIAGDVVIFGGEDRHVYAIDADTGALLWQAQTGAAVVSSPAVAGALVLIGSDDGGVYAYDIATGALVWDYAADAAIEAPIVVAGDVAYAASNTGALAALDARTGAERWVARIGAGVRSAPALGDGLVVVVDEAKRLTALASDDGRRLWRDAARRYSGAPVVINGSILAIDEDGTFRLFDRAGQNTRQWATSELIDITETGNRYDFTYGPVVGGGAVWAVNARSILWRLGP